MTKILRYFTLVTVLAVVGCFTYQNVQDYKESFAKCGTPEMAERKENGTVLPYRGNGYGAACGGAGGGYRHL